MPQPIHGNPIFRILAAVGALVLTAMAVFVGAIAFLAFLGLAIIAFVVFRLRLWMARRRMASARRRHGPASGPDDVGVRRRRVIEGEYREYTSDRKD